jgi:SWI/SNF-related matrix-associated actin-dependent regulator 1 of chromatin subfamily A
MFYRLGEWRRIVGEFCSTALETCNDPDYENTLKLLRNGEIAHSLMPHQVEASAFLASRMGAILADDMGLGKTRSALAAVRFLGDKGLPAMIVTPAGLRRVWVDEVSKFWKEAKIIVADKEDDIKGKFDLVVVSYTKLKAFVGKNSVAQIKTLIVDEAHSFKNARALYGEQRRAYSEKIQAGDDPGVHRTALLFSIAENIPRVYCLTGTPITSRPKELFNLLKLTRHTLGRNFIQFSSRYCGGRNGRFGWISDGCTHPEELRGKLKNHVLRRHKKNILKLPRKEIAKVSTPLDMRGQFKYSGAWEEYISMVRETRSGEEAARVWQARHLVQISLLRQICSESKIPKAVERILNHEGKVVVFSTYTQTLSLLKSELETSGVTSLIYDGSLNEKQRAEAVFKFQESNDLRVFIAQTETAKVGLTLTAATLVIFLDLVYTPADHFQAEDRCYRIGQTSEVRIEYFLCPGTVEDHLLDLHEAKKSVISKIFDEDLADETDIVSSDVKKELITRLKADALKPPPKQHQINLGI